MKTFGTKGRPNLAAVGRNYRAALKESSEDIERARLLGDAAKQSAATAKPQAGDSSFGPKTRHLQRQRLRATRQALAQTASIEDKEQGILVLSERLVDLRADLPSVLSIARSAVRGYTKGEADRVACIDRGLLEFERTIGRQQLEWLRRAAPKLSTEGFKPVPAPEGCLCFEHAPAQEATVTQAVAWALQSKDTNCSAGVRQYWEQMHTAASDDSCTQNPETKEQRLCQQAGRCLCAGDGKGLLAVQRQFIKALKKLCPPASSLRQDLMSGYIVAKLSGSLDENDMDSLLNAEVPFKHLYVHLGRVLLSPFRPTLQLMEQVVSFEEDLGVPGTVYVKACGVTSAGSSSGSVYSAGQARHTTSNVT